MTGVIGGGRWTSWYLFDLKSLLETRDPLKAQPAPYSPLLCPPLSWLHDYREALDPQLPQTRGHFTG